MYTLIASDKGMVRDKIKAIKGIRVLADLGLKEAKLLVEAVYEENYDNVVSILSRDEVERQERDYDEAQNNLILGGVKLIHTRKASAIFITKQLKQLALYATENDCYHLGNEILNILNKEDRQTSNKK